MKDILFLSGFFLCVSARHAPASRSFFEESPPNSEAPLLKLERPNMERTHRAAANHKHFDIRTTNQSQRTNKIKNKKVHHRRMPFRPNNRRFLVNTKVEQDNEFAFCNTDSEGKFLFDKENQYISGSKGFSLSEGNEMLKSLLCKSKSYKITMKDGELKRVAADGAAMLSHENDANKFLSPQKTTKNLELGSSGKSAIGNNAIKKDVVAAIKTQSGNAGSAALTKSRLVKGGSETMSSVSGTTNMKKNALSMRSWGNEATVISTNPKNKRPAGHRNGETLTQMKHHKKSNFEIEI